MVARTLPRAVVVGVDATAGAPAAVAYGVAEAERHGLPLHLVHVVSLLGGTDLTAPAPTLPEQRAIRELRRRTTHAVGDRMARTTSTTFTLRHGSPVGELIAVAPPGSHLVLGADRRAAGRPVGLIAEAVAARSGCPVHIVPPTHVPTGGPGKVVVGFKAPQGCASALAAGFAAAARRGQPLEVVHVTGPALVDPLAAGPTAASALEALVAALRTRWPGVEASVRLCAGPVAAALRVRTGPTDLLVLGRSVAWCTHPALGPVDLELTHRAPCPVMVVPPEHGHDPAGRPADHSYEGAAP
jgi:nucleotide-binding universal stress UspA family protein